MYMHTPYISTHRANLPSPAGYIAGGDNGVGANSLKSTDGGNTWNSLPIAPAAMLLAVATASAESAAITGIGLLAGANQSRSSIVERLFCQSFLLMYYHSYGHNIEITDSFMYIT
jgi:hypothetical protein